MAEGARYAKRLLASRATNSAEQKRALSVWRWVPRRRDEAPGGARTAAWPDTPHQSWSDV
ncbi:hypothetical protein B0H14DRAFT_3519715 [Mycena olivaceomarginata]|nr:hypothetical protein B0H14DRAFT_3519715 [Mycena olivaceomarginata]